MRIQTIVYMDGADGATVPMVNVRVRVQMCVQFHSFVRYSYQLISEKVFDNNINKSNQFNLPAHTFQHFIDKGFSNYVTFVICFETSVTDCSSNFNSF